MNAPMAGIFRATLLLASLAVSAQQVTLRTETRLVQVSVVVHDRKGAPVSDLERTDFTLTENGVPQKMAFFAREWEPAPAVKLPELPAGAASNRTGVANGATILLVDALNMPPLYRDRAAAQVEAFLRAVTPRQRVAVYILGGDLTSIVDFTTDTEALLETLRKYKVERADTRMDVLRAEQRLAEDSRASLIAEAAAMAAAFMSKEMRVVLDNHIAATLNALRVIALRVRGIPGRKNLVWLTFGIPLRNGSRTFTVEFDEAMRGLNDAGVAVYPASPHGLSRFAEIAGARVGPKTQSSRLAAAKEDDAGDRRAMARQTAVRTGGRVMETEDLEAGGRQILADARASYVLAYYPAQGELDGKWRKIEVRLGRPGLEARHRAGYYATEATHDTRLAAAVSSPLDATGIGLDAWLERAPGAGETTVAVRVHGAGLAMEDRGGRQTCPLEIVFVQADKAGKQVDGVRDNILLLVPQQAVAQTLGNGLEYRKTLRLTPRTATVRIAARSLLDGAIGSLRLPIRAE